MKNRRIEVRLGKTVQMENSEYEFNRVDVGVSCDVPDVEDDSTIELDVAMDDMFEYVNRKLDAYIKRLNGGNGTKSERKADREARRRRRRD